MVASFLMSAVAWEASDDATLVTPFFAGVGAGKDRCWVTAEGAGAAAETRGCPPPSEFPARDQR